MNGFSPLRAGSLHWEKAGNIALRSRNASSEASLNPTPSPAGRLLAPDGSRAANSAGASPAILRTGFEDRRCVIAPSFAEGAAQRGERHSVFDNRLNVPVVRRMLEIHFERSHKIRFVDRFCR